MTHQKQAPAMLAASTGAIRTSISSSAHSINPEAAFAEAMAAHFGALDFVPVADGQIHRFRVPGDKRGTLNGWYLLHSDGKPAGVFASWKGEPVRWSMGHAVDPITAAILGRRIEEAKRQREAERQQAQQLAAEIARMRWAMAEPASDDHPYLMAKKVPALGLRTLGGDLLVPLYWRGELVNLQTISPTGEKRFLPGGRITGTYSPVGRPTEGGAIYLCEGWATAAAIHLETGEAVAAAMTCGNLLPAGQAIKARNPASLLIVAGDDDRRTAGNPGRAKAEDAARALGAGLVMPAWPEGAPLTLTDFNDLRNWLEVRP